MKNSFLLKLGISLGLLAILFFSLDLPTIVGILAQSNLYFVLAAIGVLLLFFVVSTYKWQALLAHTGNTASYWELLHLNLLGQFYNMILPGQVGGEVVKGIRLRRFNVSTEQAALSLLADRATGLLALLLLGLFGLTLSSSSNQANKVILPWVFLVIVLLTGLVVYLLTGRGLVIPVRLSNILRLSRIKVVYNLLSRLQSIKSRQSNWLSLGEILGLSFAAQLLVCVLNLLVCLALNVQLAFPAAMWVAAVVLVAQALPISVAGLGVREGMYVYMLVQLGIQAQIALAVSLLMFVAQITVALLGGLIDFSISLKDPRRSSSPPEPQIEPATLSNISREHI